MSYDYAAIFLKTGQGLDGSDGETVEVPLHNGITPIPAIEITRFKARELNIPDCILVAIRHAGVVEPIK